MLALYLACHQSLKKYMITNENEFGDCSICLDKICTEFDVVRKPAFCDHYFHESCLIRMLRFNYKCPNCRQIVFKVPESLKNNLSKYLYYHIIDSDKNSLPNVQYMFILKQISWSNDPYIKTQFEEIFDDDHVGNHTSHFDRTNHILPSLRQQNDDDDDDYEDYEDGFHTDDDESFMGSSPEFAVSRLNTARLSCSSSLSSSSSSPSSPSTSRGWTSLYQSGAVSSSVITQFHQSSQATNPQCRCHMPQKPTGVFSSLRQFVRTRFNIFKRT